LGIDRLGRGQELKLRGSFKAVCLPHRGQITWTYENNRHVHFIVSFLASWHEAGEEILDKYPDTSKKPSYSTTPSRSKPFLPSPALSNEPGSHSRRRQTRSYRKTSGCKPNSTRLLAAVLSTADANTRSHNPDNHRHAMPLLLRARPRNDGAACANANACMRDGASMALEIRRELVGENFNMTRKGE
jgi:hypothetical protein